MRTDRLASRRSDVATPADPDIIKILDCIAVEAENRGLNAEDILAGMLWRKVRLKGGEIVAREDDQNYSAVLELCRRKGLRRPDGRIDYFVIDGFHRLAAASEAFSSDLGSWKGVPTIPSIVIRGRRGVSMDVLSVAFLQLMLNVSGAPDLVERLPPSLRGGLHQLVEVLRIQFDWL